MDPLKAFAAITISEELSTVVPSHNFPVIFVLAAPLNIVTVPVINHVPAARVTVGPSK